MSLLARALAPRTTAHAHCDLPCGVYDPAQARIEAESVKAICEKYQQNTDPEFRTRALAIKEERSDLVKHHLWVLWTDYFKPPHFEKYPQLDQLFNDATKLARRRHQGRHRPRQGRRAPRQDRRDRRRLLADQARLTPRPGAGAGDRAGPFALRGELAGPISLAGGSSRDGGARCVSPSAVLPDHHDRAPGVLHAVDRDGAEQHAAEAAKATGTDHKKAGATASLDELSGRIAKTRALYRQIAMLWHVSERPVEQLGGFLLHLRVVLVGGDPRIGHRAQERRRRPSA